MLKFLSKTKKENLKGIAILRLDFNTKDSWRIEKSIETIKFLIKNADKIIIISHKGRPENFDEKLSLKKQVKYLESKLKQKINFINHFNFKKIKEEINAAPPKSIFLLENIRFLKEESENSNKLAKQLASLGNYFVNDAFAVNHRNGSSITGIPKFLPSFVGLELEKEILFLDKAIKNPIKPLVLILGGTKAKDKLGVIKNFINKAKFILIGGASANTFLYLKGINIYDSKYENDIKLFKEIKKFINSKKIILPEDFQIYKNQILDIGPQTIENFKNKIKLAKTIIWNGPLGKIEQKPFHLGTLKIAKAIVKNKKAFKLIGGGETVMFLKKYNLDKKIDFISTGGGAMLEYLAGKKLPGIEILK